jgi:hypothetical protein
MSQNPRVVALDTVFYWDHVIQRLPRGTVIDVPEGSALEAAIGASRLVPLGASAPPHPVAFGGGGESASATSNGPQAQPAVAGQPAKAPGRTESPPAREEPPAPAPAEKAPAPRKATTPPQRRNTIAARTRKPGGSHGG